MGFLMQVVFVVLTTAIVAGIRYGGGVLGVSAVMKIEEVCLAKQQPLRSLTPRDRIDHVLSDVGDRRLEIVSIFCPIVLVLGLITSGAIYGGVSGAAMRALLALDTIVVGIIGYQAVRYVRDSVRRKRITEALMAERSQWDPEGDFSAVVVVHTDSCATSVNVFDTLSKRCPPRGLAVVQYCDFQWPRYTHRINDVTGNIDLNPLQNPEAIKDADLAVLLNFGVETSSTKAEVRVLEQAGKPLVRLEKDPSGRYVITGDGLSCAHADIEAAIESTIDLLAQLKWKASKSAELSISSGANPAHPVT